MMQHEEYRVGLGRNQSLVEQLREFQKNPKSLVFVSLADQYREQGLFQQALDILEEGLAFHPQFSSAYLVRARCWLGLRRYADALSEVKKTLVWNPENLKALKLSAAIYLRLGQKKAAAQALSKVLLLYPQDQEAARQLEELRGLTEKKEIDRAVFEAPLSNNPGKIEEFQVSDMPQSLAILGVQKDPQQASCEEAVQDEDLDSTFATRTIAELYLRQGLPVKAKRVLRRMLRDDPLNQWARDVLHELESNGIVTTYPRGGKKSERAEKKAKVLEKLLLQVRLWKDHPHRVGSC